MARLVEPPKWRHSLLATPEAHMTPTLNSEQARLALQHRCLAISTSRLFSRARVGELEGK
jgi:hypothetical protein